MRLKGKTAIVTGAGSGFGAGIARKFAAEGAKVMVADINTAAARTVADEIGGISQTVNVADAASVAALADAARAAFGDPDILVNNAGVTHLARTADDRRGGVRPGLPGQLQADLPDRAFRAFVLAMKSRGTGAILKTSPRLCGPSPRPPPELVQCVEGLDDHRDEDDGGGSNLRRSSRGSEQGFAKAKAGKRRCFWKSFLWARGYARDAAKVFASTRIPRGVSTPEDTSNAAAFLVGTGRGVDDHRRGARRGRRWRRCICRGRCPDPGYLRKEEGRTMRPGPRNLIDARGLGFGNAEDRRGSDPAYRRSRCGARARSPRRFMSAREARRNARDRPPGPRPAGAGGGRAGPVGGGVGACSLMPRAAAADARCARQGSPVTR